MIVTLICNDTVASITLPKKIAGQYWLYRTAGYRREKLIGIEGIGDSWILKSNQKIKVYDYRGDFLKNTVLSGIGIYILKDTTGEKSFLFTEPVTEGRQTFTKYFFEKDIRLIIGRSESCDIVYGNQYVSSRHAVLKFYHGHWSVEDTGSANGVFVNGHRESGCELSVGDCVFIMGLKIVIGKDFAALNNPEGFLIKKYVPAHKYIPQVKLPSDEYELPEIKYYYRSPRFKRDIKTAEFKVDSPPQSPINEEMPWILVMGASLTMGVMSIMTMIFAIMTSNIMSLTMGGSMFVGTVLLPVISKAYEKRRKKKKEKLRQIKYGEYLDSVSDLIEEECRLQAQILRENYISIEACEQRIEDEAVELWERSILQNDFLKLRLGCGDISPDINILYSERHFSVEEDVLNEKLFGLCETPKLLKNVPITYSLYEDFVSGIIGERRLCVEFAKGLIIEIAALYGYDEVRLVFLYDEEEEAQFEFVKWLPHTWSDDWSFRFIGRNQDEVKQVWAYLKRVYERRKTLSESDVRSELPYFVVFSMDRTLYEKSDIKLLLSEKSYNLNFSIVTFYDEFKNLPKECSKVVELDGDGGRVFDKNDISGKFIEFRPDIYPTKNPLKLSIKLANVKLDTCDSAQRFPEVVDFLQMFGVGKVEHLNVLSRWSENNPVKSLETPVGVDAFGNLFTLDLHERFHGPHGLVAGMTGSGKSEFIITYILSLAVNYHPYEVSFILIDYKGGGMAKSFEGLPHTAGIITNLDGAGIKRSLISIESELKRRQALFAKTGREIGASNIDIYRYQKLFREGRVSEPLSHLFIISDEFAELKTQQPEFMSQLISAARIGRSLGIHLILATQKPGGVVDDQIWSNSRFKVCLKVQERADSMDMLKREDAALLTETGRFYLQVGYNEVFKMGQSAWAGAKYVPSEQNIIHKSREISVIDRNGQVQRQAGLKTKASRYEDAKKQLDVVNEYLRETAGKENIKIRQLWLEPIPQKIYLEDLIEKYSECDSEACMRCIIGEYDDTVGQRQCGLWLNISEEGNTVVFGGADSGKTMFLRTMIYSLIHRYTPNDLNIYILDFADETLKIFENAPHVGGVIFSSEDEKVNNFLKLIKNESDRRKKCFSDYGGGFLNYISESKEKIPYIVVIISNFSALTEIYEDRLETIEYLLREGNRYGIYFVITSLGTGGVRYKFLQYFKRRIALQLNDESDYMSVVGKTEGLVPSRFKGRGLIKFDALYEFQVAYITKEKDEFSFVREECIRLGKQWQGAFAVKIPVMPENISVDFLNSRWSDDKIYDIPVGIETQTLNTCCYSFDRKYINLIMSAGNEYRPFVESMVNLIEGKGLFEVMLFDITLLKDYSKADVYRFASERACEEGIKRLFDILVDRHNSYKQAEDKIAVIKEFNRIIVFINSISSLLQVISEECREKLKLILEKGACNYNIHIIIGEQAVNMSAYAYEKWYKLQVSQTEGIWIGRGITEQYQLKIPKASREMHEEISEEFGYVIQNGQCRKAKFLMESRAV